MENFIGRGKSALLRGIFLSGEEIAFEAAAMQSISHVGSALVFLLSDFVRLLLGLAQLSARAFGFF